MPLQGPTVSAHLLVQSASVAAPMLVPGIFLPPGTGAPITMQGPAFLPMASTLLLFPRVPAVPVLMQSAAMPPMTSSPLTLNQSTPYPSTYLASPAWPMCMPSYLPQPQIQQSSAQAELEQLALQSQELEARELEVERRNSIRMLSKVLRLSLLPPL